MKLIWFDFSFFGRIITAQLGSIQDWPVRGGNAFGAELKVKSGVLTLFVITYFVIAFKCPDSKPLEQANYENIKRKD